MKLFKTEREVIQEIHDSFDSAQNELLEQANLVIKRYKPIISDKAERLQNLGFVNSETVLNNKKINDLLISSKQDADLVNYYKASYPFLKFLKEDQLESICKNYNLVFAPVARYKKDVPEKNVLEIENAQPLKYEDKANNVEYCLLKKDCSFWLTGSLFDKDWMSIFNKEWNKVPKRLNRHFSHEHRASSYLRKNHGLTYQYIVSKVDNITEDREGLFIAAPKSHFDLQGLKNNKLGFFNFTVKEVKDPIVFRYVKGGIQVLSKWGLEVNDEMLQHGILN